MVKSDLKLDVTRGSYEFFTSTGYGAGNSNFHETRNSTDFQIFKTRIEDGTTRTPMVKSDFRFGINRESCEFLKVPNQEREGF